MGATINVGIHQSPNIKKDRLRGLMQSLPALTVVIPAYNAAKTIPATLRSLQAVSKFLDLHVVLADDGSSDETADVAKKAAWACGLRISIVSHANNLGGGAARNTAVRQAQTEEIFCLDSDNLIEAKSFIGAYKHFISRNCETLSFSDIAYFGYRLRYVKTWKFTSELAYLSDALADPRIPPASSGNMFFQKRLWSNIGGYPEDLGSLDAYGFALKILTQQPIAVFLNSRYFHRLGHQSYWVRDSQSARSDAWQRLFQRTAGLIPGMQEIDSLLPYEEARTQLLAFLSPPKLNTLSVVRHNLPTKVRRVGMAYSGGRLGR